MSAIDKYNFCPSEKQKKNTLNYENMTFSKSIQDEVILRKYDHIKKIQIVWMKCTHFFKLMCLQFGLYLNYRMFFSG